MTPNLIRLIEENGLTLHGDIEYFAHLVAAAERSECVDIVIDNSDMDGICCADDVLEAIRARGVEK